MKREYVSISHYDRIADGLGLPLYYLLLARHFIAVLRAPRIVLTVTRA